MPQDATVFPDLPPKKNSAPRIDGTSYIPADRVTIVKRQTSTACPANPPAFQVVIVEEDTDDTILQQWFVDRNTQNNMNEGALTGEILGGNGTQTRIATSPSSLWGKLRGITDKNFHTVEVFVTDGNFSPTIGKVDPVKDPRHQLKLPDGGLHSDIAYYDTTFWLVQVEDCE